MEKNCPECGEKIIGRIDKIFCSDQCRNTYNNRQNRASTNLIRKINSKLQKKPANTCKACTRRQNYRA
jgi:predicted nucleic acid-binding Zn ribbon protein